MNHARLLVPALLVVSLSGCAAAVVTGAAATANALHDRRTVGSQIDDTAIEFKFATELARHPGLEKQSRISATSVNGIVLLTGQVANDQLKRQAGELASRLAGVRKVHNQLRIGLSDSLSQPVKDSWITAKVKSQLLADAELDALHIKVVTEQGEVFLMGLVRPEEADKAVAIARQVDGVRQVFKAFEYLPQ